MKERFYTYTLTRHRFKKTAGWFLVCFGVIGIILPIIPGLVLIFVGLEIIGLHFVFTEKLKFAFKQTFSNNQEPSHLDT